MQMPNITRSFILTVIGIILLICILLTGAFAPPHRPAAMRPYRTGVWFEVQRQVFTRPSSVVLLIGVVCIIYTYLTVQSM